MIKVNLSYFESVRSRCGPTASNEEMALCVKQDEKYQTDFKRKVRKIKKTFKELHSLVIIRRVLDRLKTNEDDYYKLVEETFLELPHVFRADFFGKRRYKQKRVIELSALLTRRAYYMGATERNIVYIYLFEDGTGIITIPKFYKRKSRQHEFLKKEITGNWEKILVKFEKLLMAGLSF